MFQELCKVLENRRVAPGHYVVRLASKRIGGAAKPGQFVQVGCGDKAFLPRPFSFLDASAKEFSILYHVVGVGTAALAQAKKGDALTVMGPLGNGFLGGRGKGKGISILVGGGVGIPPLYHFAKSLPPKNVHVFLGARNKSLLLCESGFRELGVTLHLTTDDGSKGSKGFVTAALEAHLKQKTPSHVYTYVYTCGPTPMMKTVAANAAKHKIPCQVSVEVPMACGFGACLGCAVKLAASSRQPAARAKAPLQAASCHLPANYRYAMACTEGPVFLGSDIIWE